MFDAVRAAVVRPIVVPCAAALLAVLAAPAAAQNEDALRAFFEGKRVVVKMDMPGTSEGVDVRVDATRPIDYQRYGDRLKVYGTAIRAGELVVVTLVKVKKDLVEFQLGGGGYGTFGDETSAYVYMPLVEKSNREKELEKKVKDEPDSRRKRELERERDDLRERRERENRRIEAERHRAEERKRERIAEDRLHGGSRFNLRYGAVVPAGIRPEHVMAVLADYIDFSFAGPPARPDTRAVVAPPPPRPAAGAAVPRKGMTRAEAERAFGKPLESSERREGGLVVTTLVFASADQHISAEFVGDVLVRYTVTSK